MSKDEELNVPEDMAATARLNVQMMLNYRDALRAEQRKRAGL